MYYPFLFYPIYKEMVWGGSRIKKMRGEDDSSAGHIGESWDVSCRPGEMSIVRNGVHAGMRLEELTSIDPFPLLVKIIDANDDLSVQVHPGDNDAMRLGNEKLGKNEMWYVLDAPPDGYIILGLKDGVSRSMFKTALEEGDPLPCLNRLYVKRGDVIMIPNGLIHALTKGIMVAEIQQNSDITFRVYDYGRLGLDGKPRQLHVEKALEVTDFENKLSREAIAGTAVKKGDNTYISYIDNEYFSVDKLIVAGKYQAQSDQSRFSVYTCVGGECRILSQGTETYVKYGDSVYIPPELGQHVIEADGGAELLISLPKFHE